MKVITRVKGGLGNQLFCYAAARRLALANNAELVIDDVTGFTRDQRYHRTYALDHFRIGARRATAAERLEPFERYRRCLKKWMARRKPFEGRHYLEQERMDFDARLLSIKVRDTLYLDGLWPDERYFRDVDSVIRQDLKIVPPSDPINSCLADEIRDCPSAVAVHVRWFDLAGMKGPQNVSPEYYQRSCLIMEETTDSPRYFVFSDHPEAARSTITLPKERVKFVSQNLGEENAYADLWLMAQCRHFIIANSTFSWWAAWLAPGENKVVISPAPEKGDGKETISNLSGAIPDGWLVV